MAAFIVAIGVVVLHAFATAVLWFEFRSRERRSIERIERATRLILDAIAALRGDLAPAGFPPPGGAPPPPPSGGARVPHPETPPPPPAAALPVRLVSVTRDDHPDHTRPTVEVPLSAFPATQPASVPSRRPPPHAPPVRVGAPASGVAPSTVPGESKVRPWARPYRPTAEEQETARASYSEVQTPRAAPPDVARALGARETMLGLGVEADEDRVTDEGLTRVWSAERPEPTLVSASPASSRQPMAEELVDLSDETLARVDALAREQGITRDAMLRKLAGVGLTAQEKRKADLDAEGPGEGER